MFSVWGRLVFRFRWLVLVASGALLGLSILAITTGGELKNGGPLRSSLEAARASQLIAEQISAGNARQADSGATLTLLYRSRDGLRVEDPQYRGEVERSLARLRADPRVVSVITPYDGVGAGVGGAAAAMISRDGTEAIAIVNLSESNAATQRDLGRLRSLVPTDRLSVQFTGMPAINSAFNTTLGTDLERAEFVSLPLSLVLLVLIFAAVVAAALPLAVGVLAIVGGVGATLFLARFTDVSQYALNIVTLIGLGVAIDYSLFVVNRFREEIRVQPDREQAIVATMATAGRAIAFSGITVAVGLSAMLFYQGTFLASMGAAGALVVFIAVMYGITFLPALLAVMGGSVDRLAIPGLLAGDPERGGFWRAAAGAVMSRPLLVLAPTLLFLLTLGLPFTQIRLANGDVDVLPARVEARQAYDRLLSDFPGRNANTFTVVVQFPNGPGLSSEHAGLLYDLSRDLAGRPGVVGVSSVVDLDPALDRAAYQRMYGLPETQLPEAARQVVAQTVGTDIVLLQVHGRDPASSDGARSLLRSIRGTRLTGARLLVAGQTAYDVDVITSILNTTPTAVTFVVLVTYVVLFLLTGSVVLPVKAILTNLLSISASFGALVFIFQQGHFAGLLGFTPQSIDPTVPVILFSIVFGLSMDYEVLLVARIHEEYLRTGDNRRAVAEGIERSGRLITGAAAIMFAVFAAFGLAEVVIIKSIGIGLALAVALDATVVRVLLVPAVMRLLGDLNWWSPATLRRLHQAAGLSELNTRQS